MKTVLLFMLTLVLLCVVCAAAAFAGNPYFGVNIQNEWGGFECDSIVTIDPPGYPDGYENRPYGWGTESFKSHSALEFQNEMYSRLSHSSLPLGSVWSVSGYIWSGTTNAQDHMWVSWWYDEYPMNLDWRLQVWSSDGSLLQDPVSNHDNYGAEGGAFDLPILPHENWRDGYKFTITVSNPVPEPSGLIGLAAGGISLVGLYLAAADNTTTFLTDKRREEIPFSALSLY